MRKSFVAAMLGIAVCASSGAFAESAGASSQYIVYNSVSYTWGQATGVDVKPSGGGKYYWVQFYSAPTCLKARWVKDGYTSTQDASSSVGGTAQTIQAGWPGASLGSGFMTGARVRAWMRRCSTTGTTASTYTWTLYDYP